MTKVTYSITKQGLTLSNNEVVEITASYKGFKTHLIVFYNSENEVLSAQASELWFTTEAPLANFLPKRMAEEVILDALNWANLQYPSIKAAYDAALEDEYQETSDALSNVESVIDLADHSNFISNCEYEIKKQELKRKEELRLASIEEEWMKYPRISKPKSRNLPLKVTKELVGKGLSIAYKDKQGISFMNLSVEVYKNGWGYNERYIESKSSKSPLFSNIVRGWYEQSSGYSGGHVSQSNYNTYNTKPNSQASYFLDTTTSGNTSGYYPSMLSF